MSAQSHESRAVARALASGLVVPTLLIAAFLACARATYGPTPQAASKPANTPVTGQVAANAADAARVTAAPTREVSPLVDKRVAEAQVAAVPGSRPAKSKCSGPCHARDAKTAEPLAEAAPPAPAPVAPPAPVAQTALAVFAPSPLMVPAAMGGFTYGFSDDDREFFWALVEPRDGRSRQTIGSTDDRAQRAITRALRQQRGKFLYLRIDNRDYIVRDADVLASATEMVQPMQELGKKMGELGGRQGALGGRQGVLGGEQGRLGARQAELSVRQAELSMRMQSRQRRGLSTADIEREMRVIDTAIRQCSRQQSELGRRQSALGEQQSTLGEEQSRYGEQMNRLSKEIEKEMRKLARQAISSGDAVELEDIDA